MSQKIVRSDKDGLIQHILLKGEVLLFAQTSGSSPRAVVSVFAPGAMTLEFLSSVFDGIYEELGHPAEMVFKTIAPESAMECVSVFLTNRKIPLIAKVEYVDEAEVLFLPRKASLKVARKSQDEKIKVLIVDDSKTIRALLTQVLSEDPGIKVVGALEDASQIEAYLSGLEKSSHPDVITLDIQMPKMSGVDWIKNQLPKYPIPTVMVSATSIEDGPQVLEALDAGAVDYIQKPSYDRIAELGHVIRSKVKEAKGAKVRLPSLSKLPNRLAAVGVEHHAGALVVIGSSTGGTEALREILTQLPDKIPPIVIVQHIPAVFSKAFADRLNGLCAFEVLEAKDGDEVKPNRVLIAPGGFQLKIRKLGDTLKVKLEDEPHVNRHKPSVDYMFQSVVSVVEKRRVLAIMLTGMGGDGSVQMLALKNAGANTFAQDEASCIVYGMPREAVRLGAVEKVLPLKEMAGQIVSWAGRSARKKVEIKKAS